MGRIVTGAVGGLLAGALVAEAMRAGRRGGFLHKTGTERQEEWLDATFAASRRLGPVAAKRVARTNWLIAATGAGALYGILQPRRHPAHPLLAGGVFGAVLYALDTKVLAPMLGVKRPAQPELPAVTVQRMGFHALFGMATAVIAGGLSPRPLIPPQYRPGRPVVRRS